MNINHLNTNDLTCLLKQHKYFKLFITQFGILYLKTTVLNCIKI